MTTMTTCLGGAMRFEEQNEPSAQAHDRPNALSEEWQDRLKSLEQWVCELLVKNQKLRMSLQSVISAEREGQDIGSIRDS
jgi:hypothetical protein